MRWCPAHEGVAGGERADEEARQVAEEPGARNRLFKGCRQWKTQQRALWAEVRRATGRGRDRFKIRGPFADERRTQSVPNFLRTAGVGSRVGPRAVPPKPGEEPTDDGDVVGERGSKDADEGRGECEELEGEKGAKDEEEQATGAESPFLSCFFFRSRDELPVADAFLRLPFFFFCNYGKGQAGAAGCCRGPASGL